MAGVDVDAYGNKPGAATIAAHEARLGPLPPTYAVTARGFTPGAEGVASAVYLYRVPDDWRGRGVLEGGGVETIQPHLRYLVAPGSLHHTGARYALYHQDNGPTPLDTLVLPPREDLPALPDNWCEALYRKPRRRAADGTAAAVTIEDIEAVASEWIWDEDPRQLWATVAAVREATGEGQTRLAFHRALWIAARKARAGCYPFSRAVAEIETAAIEAYAARGLGLDLGDFDRSISHAVSEALDMTDAEVSAWGVWNDPEIELEFR
jgi:hypothetical protein